VINRFVAEGIASIECGAYLAVLFAGRMVSRDGERLVMRSAFAN
jgi:hypothetical protein